MHARTHVHIYTSILRSHAQRTAGLWGRLTCEASNKEELQARRNASIDRAHARLEEARLTRLDRKQKNERCAGCLRVLG